MPDPGDLAFLEECRSGSGAARERFVRRFAGLVHWSIRKTLGEAGASDHAPDDIFQEVFGKLLEPSALAGLRDDKAVKSWIVVVSCRAALDAVRALRRRERRETSLDVLLETEQAAGALTAATDPDPGEEKMCLVRELVDRLPAREKACIRFHYLDGMTFARIGEILGLPPSTVSTVVRRACDSLRARLKQRGHENS